MSMTIFIKHPDKHTHKSPISEHDKMKKNQDLACRRTFPYGNFANPEISSIFAG